MQQNPRKRLLISPDRTTIRLAGWKPTLYAFTDKMYLRLYYCFDREQSILESAAASASARESTG